MRRGLAVLAAAILALHPVVAGAADAVWEQFAPVQGVFDLGGPRSDGSVIIAGSGGLATLKTGASMIGVRCDAACHVTTVAATPTTAHGEGHLVFAIAQVATPGPSHTPDNAGEPTRANDAANTAIRIMAVVAVISVAAWLILSRRRR